MLILMASLGAKLARIYCYFGSKPLKISGYFTSIRRQVETEPKKISKLNMETLLNALEDAVLINDNNK